MNSWGGRTQSPLFSVFSFWNWVFKDSQNSEQKGFKISLFGTKLTNLKFWDFLNEGKNCFKNSKFRGGSRPFWKKSIFRFFLLHPSHSDVRWWEASFLPPPSAVWSREEMPSGGSHALPWCQGCQGVKGRRNQGRLSLGYWKTIGFLIHYSQYSRKK